MLLGVVVIPLSVHHWPVEARPTRESRNKQLCWPLQQFHVYFKISKEEKQHQNKMNRTSTSQLLYFVMFLHSSHVSGMDNWIDQLATAGPSIDPSMDTTCIGWTL